MALATTEEAIAAIKAGDMVVLVDDEDRENEGDLVLAAECVTPEAVNFMAKEGRGLICLSLTEERLRALDIPMMVGENTSARSTAFTVSIEAQTGVTTGISAADRARTIQVAVDDDAGPKDLTRPGHIFPLRAMQGGVLVRTGHTEGSIDLCRLAGRKPAAVICEVMRDDGEMARVPDLLEFAKKHGLLVASIADLVQYRLQRDSLVERMVSAPLESEFGDLEVVVYRSLVDGNQHYAVVAGDPRESDEPCLVRVQHQCLTSDVFHSTSCNCGRQLRAAMRRIADEGCGVIVYLHYARHSRLENVLTHVLGHKSGAAARHLGEGEDREEGATIDLRQVGVGAQILADLGVGKMRLMTSKPRKIVGLAGYGLEIVEQFSPLGEAENDNVTYLGR